MKINSNLRVPVSHSTSSSPVEQYWGKHTVNSQKFKTANESLYYLSWRNEQYPFFKELMFPKFDTLADKIILDYGCGPGNDLVNFLIYTQAKKIIGVDVSEKALILAKKRLALHRTQSFKARLNYIATVLGYKPDRISLYKISDQRLKLPLTDQFVDYIHCSGVLMHLSEPHMVLREFRRVLKAEGKIRAMVYNTNSIWRHLYVGYQKMSLGQPIEEISVSDQYHGHSPYQNMSLDEAFKRSTDGENCPISFSFTPESFSKLATESGFQATFVGSYFATLELDIFEKFSDTLQNLPHLASLNRESKAFLKGLQKGFDGYPKYHGVNAGIGAIYELQKI